MTIPGFTSTGSKRPDALFGNAPGAPQLRMTRAEGCCVWDTEGREYIDTVMALGAVALGYGHPVVNEAVRQAVADGAVGSLPPVHEAEVAERLQQAIPLCEAVRFLKTGAEAVAAAVRIARVHTGRERVIASGYHGWLDWCVDGPGVPMAVRTLTESIEPGDVGALERAFGEAGPVAAVVLEPAVNGPPRPEWLERARQLASRHGAVLVFDEIKTAFRVAIGGVAELTGITPDLIVLGKALGNGMPISVVGGAAPLMEAATETWISSTLATEYVSLAAARAVLHTYASEPVIEQLRESGAAFYGVLERIADAHGDFVTGVCGMPQLCYLTFRSEETGGRVARAALERGLLFKRSAYNYVSLAHTDEVLAQVEERLSAALAQVATSC